MTSIKTPRKKQAKSIASPTRYTTRSKTKAAIPASRKKLMQTIQKRWCLRSHKPPTNLNTLPKELRLIIWHLVRPRIIKLRVSPNKNQILSSTPPPVTFSINQESRYETKRFYKKHAQLYVDLKVLAQGSFYPFFDPAVDTVTLGPGPGNELLDFDLELWDLVDILGGCPARPALDIVQSLQIPRSGWNFEVFQLMANSRFKNLKEIVFEGGGKNLKTEEQVLRCRDTIEHCYEVALEKGEVVDVPKLWVNMPKGVTYEFTFEDLNKIDKESAWERKSVRDFIMKVKAGRLD